MKNNNYSEKLKHPMWQKKRLEIMSRDKFTCKKCNDEETMLQVHHLEYSEGEPWEIENNKLITLCKDCHFEIEQLKKDDENIDFKNIKIFKEGNWIGGGRIMLIKHKSVCTFRCYDKHDNYIIGYNLQPELISVLSRFSKQANKYVE